MLIRLERFAYAPMGTFGVIRVADLFWYTVERPMLGNRPFISCIPEGAYELRETVFNPKAGPSYPTLEVVDVPGRSSIKLHRANWPKDVQGCIGVGKELRRDSWGIAHSTVGLGEFLGEVLGKEDLRLAVLFCAPVI